MKRLFALLLATTAASLASAHDGGFSLLQLVDGGTAIGAPANPLPVVLSDDFADSDQVGYGFGASASIKPTIQAMS